MSKKSYLYLFFVLLNVFDCLTTMAVMNHGGVEVNPAMVLIINNYSYVGMWAVKALVLLPIGFFLEKLSECSYVILITVFTAVVTTNLIGMIL